MYKDRSFEPSSEQEGNPLSSVSTETPRRTQ